MSVKPARQQRLTGQRLAIWRAPAGGSRRSALRDPGERATHGRKARQRDEECDREDDGGPEDARALLDAVLDRRDEGEDRDERERCDQLRGLGIRRALVS